MGCDCEDLPLFPICCLIRYDLHFQTRREVIIQQLKVNIQVSNLHIHLTAEVLEVNKSGLFTGEEPMKVSYIFPNGDRYGE